MGPGAGQGAGLGIGLERVPLGLVLELQCGEGNGKGWDTGCPPALVFKVDEGLSEQGEAVLQVRVELGLPPWAEVSHWKRKSRKMVIHYQGAESLVFALRSRVVNFEFQVLKKS